MGAPTEAPPDEIDVSDDPPHLRWKPLAGVDGQFITDRFNRLIGISLALEDFGRSQLLAGSCGVFREQPRFLFEILRRIDLAIGDLQPIAPA